MIRAGGGSDSSDGRRIEAAARNSFAETSTEQCEWLGWSSGGNEEQKEEEEEEERNWSKHGCQLDPNGVFANMPGVVAWKNQPLVNNL